MPEHGSPTVRRRRLAAELRKLREQSGRTGDEVAAELRWSPSKISRYELARTGFKPAEVRRLLDVYGVDPSRQGELLALARDTTEKGWWEAYADILPEPYAEFIGLEDEATTLLTWQLECVPGLLQADRYAREINAGLLRVTTKLPPIVADRRSEVRLRRQQVLTKEPPPVLRAVLDESALLRQVGDGQVMREQLAYLAEIARLPNVTIRVLPLASQDRVITTSFVLLGFDDSRRAGLGDVVYTESLTSALYVEGETQTYEYQLIFESLERSALTPEESVRKINEVARLWAP